MRLLTAKQNDYSTEAIYTDQIKMRNKEFSRYLPIMMETSAYNTPTYNYNVCTKKVTYLIRAIKKSELNRILDISTSIHKYPSSFNLIHKNT